MLGFLINAALGAISFVLILYFAQSRYPRAAGMMLTFPTLNGIGLLAGESGELYQMAGAMVPMIITNGLICAGYIWILTSRKSGRGRCAWHIFSLLGICLLVWFLIASLVAPWIQSWLATAESVIWLGLFYLIGISPFVCCLWYPSRELEIERQGLWNILSNNWERIVTLVGLIGLVMVCIHIGAKTWAGRLSAFPLLPLYTLALLGANAPHACQRGAVLPQLGSTVLLGPAVAMLFVQGFVRYLTWLSGFASGPTYLGGGVLGLLVGWSLGGMLIWGLLHFAMCIEKTILKRLAN